MTLILSVNDDLYVNSGTLIDAPAARLTGNRIRFTNSDSGRVISSDNVSPAIRIEGDGATIVNEAGGVIRLDSPLLSAAAAIVGSAGNDVVMNSGMIGGFVSLGDGNDEYHQLGDAVLTSNRVDLGAGDDTVYFAPSLTSATFLQVDGGAGTDRLVISGPRQNFGLFSTGIEILDVRTNGSFEGFVGLERIEVLFRGAGHFSSALRFINSPNADVIVGGGTLSIYDRAVVRSITGDSAQSRLSIGNDTVVSGAIDLGGGDDQLSVFHSQFSNPVRSTLGSTITGGSGTDSLDIQLDGGDSFNAANATSFETVFISNRGQGNQSTPPANYNITVSGLSSATQVRISDDGSRPNLPVRSVTLTNATLGLAQMLVERRIVVNLSSDVVMGSISSIAGGPPPSTTVADDTQSMNINNAGSIIGDVNLWIGDDRFDGRLGSVGGSIYGYTGNDTLFGGAGGDKIFGGSGADILDGGSGGDVLSGGTGNDTYYADGLDTIVEGVGQGNDTLFASQSFTLDNAAEIETVVAGGARSTAAIHLTGNDLANALVGNDGPNMLSGRGGNDQLSGGAGSDSLDGGAGDDRLNGGEGDDILLYTGGIDALNGDGGGYDIADYSGFASAVLIDLEAATQYTRGTNDLYTGAWASIGTVTGVERLIGTNGNDALFGDANSNTIFYSGGLDNYDGRGGTDLLDFSLFRSGVYIDLAAPAQYTRDTGNVTSTGAWRILAYTTPSSFENTVGTAASDYVLGTAADNVFIYSGGLDDVYSGRGGSDTLDLGQQVSAVYADLSSGVVYDRANANWSAGGTYNRIAFADSIENLIGGAGGDYLAGAGNVSNRLTGGGGADSFVFRSSGGANTTDVITDFQDGVDRIRLEGFAGLTNASQLNISYDATGADIFFSGDASQHIHVLGAASASLTNADFVFG
jgi:Ca2+-binding RTX toxin-like protein